MHAHRIFGGRGCGRFDGRHGLFGRFKGRRHGWHTARTLDSSELQRVMLELLQEKPRHGYEIMTALEELSRGSYSPSPGVVYPSLTHLEELGYVTGESDGNAKLYRISDAGSGFLGKNREAVRETMERLARTPNRQDRHRMKAELWSLKSELKAAIWEKMDASEEEKQRMFGVLRRALEEIRGK